jgi:hypothetical protein
MSTAQDTRQVYALLADGTTVEIRQAVPDDFDAVQAMHEAMSPDNICLHFFSYSRRSAETEARRICQDPAPGSAALLTFPCRATRTAPHWTPTSAQWPNGRAARTSPAKATGVFTVDARIKVAPCPPQDPFLRRLR